MELLNADIDIQGTRVYCAGGIIFFIEEWMNNKLLRPENVIPLFINN